MLCFLLLTYNIKEILWANFKPIRLWVAHFLTSVVVSSAERNVAQMAMFASVFDNCDLDTAFG